MNLPDLEAILRICWTKETSSDPNKWSLDNPAYGQCAVTSLVVNDYFGGEIIWANALLPDGKEVSHYFNKINNEELDLTRIQFPEGTIVPPGIPKIKEFPSTREYVLSYPVTKQRYELLKEKVQKLLQ